MYDEIAKSDDYRIRKRLRPSSTLSPTLSPTLPSTPLPSPPHPARTSTMQPRYDSEEEAYGLSDEEEGGGGGDAAREKYVPRFAVDRYESDVSAASGLYWGYILAIATVDISALLQLWEGVSVAVHVAITLTVSFLALALIIISVRRSARARAMRMAVLAHLVKAHNVQVRERRGRPFLRRRG